MAHFPKPFFRPARNLWYVQLHGKQINLGQDKDAAFKEYHRLMQCPKPVASKLAVGIIEGFLDWAEKHKAPRTYRDYKDFLQSFVNSLPAPESFTVDELQPFHVQQWVDSKPSWGPTYCHNAITAVKRAFSWAAKIGHLKSSPIQALEKPTPQRRDKIIPEDHHTQMLGIARAKACKNLLTFMWETGARPQEFRFVEARHFNPEINRLELPPAEAKGKKRWRRIYLSAPAAALVRELSEKHPSGPIFRNDDGVAWTPFAIDCLFKRLEKKLGVKYSAYDYRHTFATRMLVAGLDHLTVAEFLGHANGSTLAKVYSHIDQKADFMRERFDSVSSAAKQAK